MEFWLQQNSDKFQLPVAIYIYLRSNKICYVTWFGK